MQIESIVSVKSLGILSTYDIEVDSKEHLFYGNGIAISNSHSCCYGLTGYDTAYLKVISQYSFLLAGFFMPKTKQIVSLKYLILLKMQKNLTYQYNLQT